MSSKKIFNDQQKSHWSQFFIAVLVIADQLFIYFANQSIIG